jgi:hypothetical protein
VVVGLGTIAATILPAQVAAATMWSVIPPGTTLNGVAACPGTDQRGYARPGSGQTDCTVGVVEYNAQPAVATPEFPYPLALPALAIGALGAWAWLRRRRVRPQPSS